MSVRLCGTYVPDPDWGGSYYRIRHKQINVLVLEQYLLYVILTPHIVKESHKWHGSAGWHTAWRGGVMLT